MRLRVCPSLCRCGLWPRLRPPPAAAWPRGPSSGFRGRSGFMSCLLPCLTLPSGSIVTITQGAENEDQPEDARQDSLLYFTTRCAGRARPPSSKVEPWSGDASWPAAPCPPPRAAPHTPGVAYSAFQLCHCQNHRAAATQQYRHLGFIQCLSAKDAGIHSCVHSFIHSFVQSFIHQCVHVFIHVCIIHSSVCACMHSCVHHVCMHSCVHSCMRTCIHSPIKVCMHSFMPAFFLHSFINVCMHLCIHRPAESLLGDQALVFTL